MTSEHKKIQKLWLLVIRKIGINKINKDAINFTVI